ncbi:hypothetical protein EW093_14645 [Thiospirochaeta perfilievii]|uniref:Uncharacterized protein n=1 Tax=Thiospirochaeta perfilievii TaxID=252967 RepID=A0A5C1QH36_9SPIO|nr:hypothetical protein [Thiospirochaeta perfilievii]QEN05886.1 hypothetical protein EW093_14645 [Thiospirochaeta perfilievii]
MFYINKKYWAFNLLFKISSTLYFMSLIVFISFFVISRQGISIPLAAEYIDILSMITYISIVLMFLSIVTIFVVKSRVMNKIKQFFKLLFRIVLCSGILLFVNTIYIFSLGIME